MRYSITSNLRIYQRTGKKYVFHWDKLNFKHIGNFVGSAEFFALERPWIFIENMSSIQVYIQQWFHDGQGAKF